MNSSCPSFFSIQIYDQCTGIAVNEIYLDGVSEDKIPSQILEQIDGLKCGHFAKLDTKTFDSAWLVDNMAKWPDYPIRLVHECPILPYRLHGGREFDLMTKGLKPLAEFSNVAPDSPIYDFIDRFFQPMVKCNRFISKTISEPTKEGKLPRTTYLFVLPEETWRIEAYLLMEKLAKKHKWSDVLERMYGTLLGYSDHENDLWSAYRCEQGIRWGLQVMYTLLSLPEINLMRQAGSKALFPVDQNVISIYLPHHGQVGRDSEAALATLDTGALAKFYVPMLKLMPFSQGTSEIAGMKFEQFQLPLTEIKLLNELIEGPIDLIRFPYPTEEKVN